MVSKLLNATGRFENLYSYIDFYHLSVNIIGSWHKYVVFLKMRILISWHIKQDCPFFIILPRKLLILEMKWLLTVSEKRLWTQVDFLYQTLIIWQLSSRIYLLNVGRLLTIYLLLNKIRLSEIWTDHCLAVFCLTRDQTGPCQVLHYKWAFVVSCTTQISFPWGNLQNCCPVIK